MKVIIFAAGSDGDIHPHLGIGCELIARGHQVAFLTSFDNLEVARECGFEAIGIIDRDDKEDFQAEGRSTGAKVKARSRFFSRKLSELCELVASRLNDQTILVAQPFAYIVAKLLHTKYGTPYVSTILSPGNIFSVKDPPDFKGSQWFNTFPYPVRKLLFESGERLIVDPIFRMLLRDPIRQLGVPPPSRVFSEWAYSPERIVGLFYDWFCPVPEDWPKQVTLAGFPLFQPNADEQKLSPGLTEFLEAGPPPIVFSPSTETKKPRRFFEAAVKTAQTLGMRGIFLTRLTNHLPKLPDTIWQESYTSLRLLLPRVNALVHNGGIGTAALALRAGIPQLILPWGFDQFNNGRLIERLGCGLVEKNLLNSSALIKKLLYLLTSPQVRQACSSAEARIASGTNGCSRAADVIEETFRGARKIAAHA